jgi:AraC-like DNA-binding protein
MKYLRHRIVVPESHSFRINRLYQEQNTDIIHSHTNYELNYVVDGSGRRFVGGNISLFAPGDLVLMGPDLPHCWEATSAVDRYTSITIHFKEDLFDSKLFQIPEFLSLQTMLERSRLGIHFKDVDIRKVEDSLEELRQLHGYESMIQILKILGYLTTVTEAQTISVADFNRDQDQLELERLNKIYDYVFRHFREVIRLSEVAREANLSESAFCIYFKKRTKKTFFTFLKEIRIGYACKLLSDSGEGNIARICFESGFNNVANFNRQFREVTGMSPREYRTKYSVPHHQ